MSAVSATLTDHAKRELAKYLDYNTLTRLRGASAVWDVEVDNSRHVFARKKVSSVTVSTLCGYSEIQLDNKEIDFKAASELSPDEVIIREDVALKASFPLVWYRDVTALNYKSAKPELSINLGMFKNVTSLTLCTDQRLVLSDLLGNVENLIAIKISKFSDASNGVVMTENDICLISEKGAKLVEFIIDHPIVTNMFSIRSFQTLIMTRTDLCISSKASTSKDPTVHQAAIGCKIYLQLGHFLWDSNLVDQWIRKNGNLMTFENRRYSYSAGRGLNVETPNHFIFSVGGTKLTFHIRFTENA